MLQSPHPPNDWLPGSFGSSDDQPEEPEDWQATTGRQQSSKQPTGIWSLEGWEQPTSDSPLSGEKPPQAARGPRRVILTKNVLAERQRATGKAVLSGGRNSLTSLKASSSKITATISHKEREWVSLFSSFLKRLVDYVKRKQRRLTSSKNRPQIGTITKQQRVLSGAIVLLLLMCSASGLIALVKKGQPSSLIPSTSLIKGATSAATATQAIRIEKLTTKLTPTPTPYLPPKPTPIHLVVVPTPTPAVCQAVNNNPWCYNFSPGSLIYNPSSNFCSYFNCVNTFWNGRGYVTQCNDGSYSKNGGMEGNCSFHGGKKRPLYSH